MWCKNVLIFTILKPYKKSVNKILAYELGESRYFAIVSRIIRLASSNFGLWSESKLWAKTVSYQSGLVGFGIACPVNLG